MALYSIDIKSIKKGAPAAGGGMGTVLTTFGDVRENTVKLIEADPTTTPIRAAGKSKPVRTVVQDGDLTLEYDLMTTDKEIIAAHLGGTATGVVPNKVWNSPLKKPTIIESYEIEDGDGGIIQLPAVQIVATLQNVYSPTDVNVIRVRGTVLQPADVLVSAVIWK